MTLDVFTHIPDEDRQLVDVDSTQILEETLDVHPYEGVDEDEAYDWDRP